MSAPKIVTFHNPLRHPVFDEKTGLKSGDKDAVRLTFSIPIHENGAKYDYDLEPGEEMQIEEALAYGVKVYAPQMVEGPAPKKK
jgi:hypothetical protein